MDSILIIEGDTPVRNNLIFLLTQAGYLCRQAEDTFRAHHLLTEHLFDLMLVDLDLADSPGLEIIEHCKCRYGAVAIVVASEHPNSLETNAALNLGAHGYLLKPYHQDLILLTINNALRLHRLELQEQFANRILEREVAAKTQHLDEQVHFLQNLLDAIPVPIYYKNTDCVYLGCNRAYEELFHVQRGTVVNKTTFDIHPPELASFFHKKDLELLQTGSTQVYERVKVSEDGTQKTALMHKATFNDIKGALAGFVGMGIDITELKQIEASLRQSERKIRTIMDNLRIGVLMIDAQLIIHQLNQQIEQWFPENVIHQENVQLLDIFVGEPEEFNQQTISQAFQQRTSQEFMVRGVTDNRKQIFRLVITPFTQENKNDKMAVVLCEDVTEKLFLERELQQTQKLEAIGQLAAGIAHEINTPIQYVGDNLRFLAESFQDIISLAELWQDVFVQDGTISTHPLVAKARQLSQAVDLDFLLEDVPNTIEQSMDGINRVAAIVRAMREFSHPGLEDKVLMDINHALENTLTVSRNAWKFVAETTTDFAEDLPLLLCLPGEINQVFLNLIVNAAHAIDESTQGGKKSKGTISLSTRAENGWLEVRIADSGAGIDNAIQDKVFDPFFTTKKIGVGTGQGLAIARNVIVDKHQGSIRFTSEPGEGTTFIIRLPIH
ncbi:MAG: PAS domain-containing protein [Desulfobulbus sp.]|nr:PAS domain-containing protein [Desulfobulbus sp.]